VIIFVPQEKNLSGCGVEDVLEETGVEAWRGGKEIRDFLEIICSICYFFQVRKIGLIEVSY